MTRPESYPVAFHRTDSANVETILQNGILSMQSQGYTFEQIKKGGTGFKLCTSTNTAEWVSRSTFVKFGGVETSWATDGMNICVDMNILASMGGEWMEDGYGANGDTHVMGDIPKEAIIGAYTDQEVINMGFHVGEDLSWGISENNYYAPIFETLGITSAFWGSRWNREEEEERPASYYED